MKAGGLRPARSFCVVAHTVRVDSGGFAHYDALGWRYCMLKVSSWNKLHGLAGAAALAGMLLAAGATRPASCTARVLPARRDPDEPVRHQLHRARLRVLLFDRRLRGLRRRHQLPRLLPGQRPHDLQRGEPPRARPSRERPYPLGLGHDQHRRRHPRALREPHQAGGDRGGVPVRDRADGQLRVGLPPHLGGSQGVPRRRVPPREAADLLRVP